MDKSALVRDGERLLQILAQENVPIKASALTYTDERGWRLKIVPTQYENRAKIYRRLADIIHPFDERFSEITLSDIDIEEPDSAFDREIPRLEQSRGRTWDDVRLGGDFYRHVITLHRLN